MRRRQLPKWLVEAPTRGDCGMEVSREEMLMRSSVPRGPKHPTAWRLVDIEMDEESPTFTYALNRKKLRRARRREGRYLLRTNLTDNDPTLLWRVLHIQLVAVEQAFQNLKQDLARYAPVFHQDEHRIEAHIFHRIPRLLSAGQRSSVACMPWRQG